MHAFFIIGDAKEERASYIQDACNHAHITNWDQVILDSEESSLTIANVREFQKQLALAPRQSPNVAGIIIDADRLTPEAQNALLKTIEEPPPHVIIYCAAATTGTILPTILSRCEIVPLQKTSPTDTTGDAAMLAQWDSIASLTNGERLALVNSVATDRDHARTWIQSSIAAIERALSSDANKQKQRADILRLLMRADKQMHANVTPKLILDAVVLQIH